jgi:outer membrane protein assembly factor BamB
LAKLLPNSNIDIIPTTGWFAPSANPVYLSAAVNESSAFFVDGQEGDAGRLLRRIEVKSGREIWRSPVESGASGSFVATQEHLFIADTELGLSCIDVRLPEKKVAWIAKTGTCVGSPFLLPNLVLAAVKNPSRLIALDCLTGENIWEKLLPSEPRTGCVFAAGRAWVGLSEVLYCESITGSRSSRSFKLGTAATSLVMQSDQIACTTVEGEIVLFQADPPEEIVRFSDALPNFPPLLVNGSLLYSTNNSIQRYDMVTGTRGQWTKIRASWPGRITSPMIMVDSHLVFATDKRGLICMNPKTE